MLPCVLIAASGSNGLNGAALDEEQVAEHLPFVARGCIVVAYDVDGAIDGETDPSRYRAMMEAFFRCEGGLQSASTALRRAQEIEPRIDVARLFAAGHGSGANVALLLAANDERIRAVAAFSPIDHAANRPGEPLVDALDGAVPGYRAFLERIRPASLAPRIKARILLFHPVDDKIAPVESSRELSRLLEAAGNPPHFVEPRSGGHVQAMMNGGLEQAATWFEAIAKQIPAERTAPNPVPPGTQRPR
jgi:dienelactone hydrolase